MSSGGDDRWSRGSRVAAGVVRGVGVVAAVVVTIVVVALALLVADRIPFTSYNVTDADRLIGFVLAGWTLAIAGLVWLIALVITWWKRPLRAKWFLAAPGLLVVGAAVLLVVGLLAPAGFSSSRAELDAVAAQARSHSPGWSEMYGSDSSRRVGQLDVRSVRHRDDGVVVVGDADSAVFLYMSGWAHSPEGPPTFDPGVRGLEVQHLEGDWYSYSFSL